MRVVIAEDLALLRDGLTRHARGQRLRASSPAVEDGDALIEAVERERPDVCVVDVRLPPTFRDEGIRAALEARRRRARACRCSCSRSTSSASSPRSCSPTAAAASATC